MIGIPGAGKSTWAKENMKRLNANYISRDSIRFAINDEGNKIYPKEKQVFNEYIHRIQESINNNENCIADATHVDEKSRKKLISNLVLKDNDEIIAVNLKVSPNICTFRNDKRIGDACVPRIAILNMAKRLNYVENFYQDDEIIYNKIIDVDEKMNENIKINNRGNNL